MKRFTFGALVILVAALVWYVFLAPNQAPVPFVHDGNLVKDTPGLTPGVWHLSYEEPGAPGLVKKLIFDVHSRCGAEDALAVCDLSFTPGQRAHVVGVEEGDAVRVTTVTYTPMPQETGQYVALYYYDQAHDTDASGTVQCSEQGLVRVERILPNGATIEDVVRLLLRGEITDEEHARGITTEFPLPNVSLVSATTSDGVLTLTFDDPQHKTSGGSCRVSVIRAQIHVTAMQFAGAKSVRFLPEDLFQP